jgi:hypothetical protein
MTTDPSLAINKQLRAITLNSWTQNPTYQCILSYRLWGTHIPNCGIRYIIHTPMYMYTHAHATDCGARELCGFYVWVLVVSLSGNIGKIGTPNCFGYFVL